MLAKKGQATMLSLYILLIILIISIFFNMRTITKAWKRRRSAEHIYSHRGVPGEEIEHSFAGYDLAILYGSKYIEQDVVLSKNGTLIVSHDLSAKRITGVNKLYGNMTDKEIAKLRTSDDQPILTLQDVFNAYKKSIYYVIELKQSGAETKAFIDIIRRNRLQKRVIVQSFEIEPLNEIAAAFPELPRLFLVETQPEFDRGLTYPNVDIIAPEKSLMNAKNVELAHNFEKEICVWTLNSDEEFKMAIELGVDTYFTDHTGKAFLFEKLYR
jgi:glycerophosphoryl diester phosphodiesterase